MSVIEAELADLEAKLRETFEHEDWSLPTEATPTVTPTGGTVHEINMDLGTLGGSRPRAN